MTNARRCGKPHTLMTNNTRPNPLQPFYYTSANNNSTPSPPPTTMAGASRPEVLTASPYNHHTAALDAWYNPADFLSSTDLYDMKKYTQVQGHNEDHSNSSTAFSPSSSNCRTQESIDPRDPLSHFAPMVINGSDSSSQNESSSANGGGARTGSPSLGGAARISDAEMWLENGTRTHEQEKINWHLKELQELQSENMKKIHELQNVQVAQLPMQHLGSGVQGVQADECKYTKINPTLPSTLHPKQRRNSKKQKNRKPFDESVETKLYDVDEFAEIVIGFVIRYCQKQEEKWQKGEDCVAVLKPDLVQGIKIRNMNWTSEDDSALAGDGEEKKKRIPKAEKIRVKAKRTMKAIVEKNGEQMAERVNNDPELCKQRDIWRTMNCGLALAAMKSEWGNDAIVRNIDIDAQFKYLFDYKNTLSNKKFGDFKLERPKLQNFFRYLAEHPRSDRGDDGALDIIVWECSRTESRVSTREHRRKYYKNELAVQMHVQAHSELYGH